MCESKVFLRKNGEMEEVMEDVVRVVIDGGKVKMWDILGGYAEVKGKVVELDLVGHKVVLEGLDEG